MRLQSLSQIGFGVDINFPCKQGKFLKYNYWSISTIMGIRKINIWYISSLLISLIVVAIPIYNSFWKLF